MRNQAIELRRLADMADVGIEFRPTALVFTTDVSFHNFTRLGGMLGAFSDASKWWIGDWLLFGDASYGEKMAQAEEETGRAYHTLQNYRYVSSKVAVPRRRDSVSHSAHAIVAPLPPEEQDEWLERCETNQWTVQELRTQIRDSRPAAEPEPRSEPQWTVEPDPDRVIEIGRRLVAEAQPNGDGRFIVSGELVAQLRACFGKE